MKIQGILAQPIRQQIVRKQQNVFCKLPLQQDTVAFSGLFKFNQKNEYQLRGNKCYRESQKILRQNQFDNFNVKHLADKNIALAYSLKQEAEENFEKVYRNITIGTKVDSGSITKPDGTIVKFDCSFENGEKEIATMSEYDSDYNLIRQTTFENKFPKSIKVFKDNGMVDLITQNANKDITILKNYKPVSMQTNNYEADAAVIIKDDKITSIAKNVSQYNDETLRIGELTELYEFGHNNIKSVKLGVRKNYFDEKICNIEYVFSPTEENQVVEINHELLINPLGTKKISKKITLNALGDRIATVEDNYRKNRLGQIEVDTKYYFSDDKTIQVAKHYKKNNQLYSANEIYSYDNSGKLDSCKVDCTMDVLNETEYKFKKHYLF